MSQNQQNIGHSTFTKQPVLQWTTMHNKVRASGDNAMQDSEHNNLYDGHSALYYRIRIDTIRCSI